MKELQPPVGENVGNDEWKKGFLLQTFKLLDVQTPARSGRMVVTLF